MNLDSPKTKWISQLEHVRHPSQTAPVENSHSGHQFVQNSRTVHLERHVHERAIKNQNVKMTRRRKMHLSTSPRDKLLPLG